MHNYNYIKYTIIFLLDHTSVKLILQIATRTIGGAILGQSCLLIAVALFGSNLPAFMVSQFPIRNRYSGIGIGQ